MEISTSIIMLKNTASEHDIYDHLVRIDQCHLPSLSERVDLKSYAKKLKDNALLIELWDDNRLVGLIAYYETAERFFYISNISVEAEYRNCTATPNLSTIMMHELTQLARTKKMFRIQLNVFKENKRAIQFYSKHGFESVETKSDDITMSMSLQINTND
ncbi:GNAT family N-acetyltransferase [Psychrosphaera sp.]|nr:GNAT family N-acetyltransferase [Psychrosphaera sp.]